MKLSFPTALLLRVSRRTGACLVALVAGCSPPEPPAGESQVVLLHEQPKVLARSPLTVTPAAADHVRAMQHPTGAKFARLVVVGKATKDGKDALEPNVEVADGVQPGDVVMESGGVTVLTDAHTAWLIEQRFEFLDWVGDSKGGGRFVLRTKKAD